MSRQWTCPDCGKETRHDRKKGGGKLCVDCAVIRVETNIRDMQDKSGAGYVRYVMGLASTIGLTPGGGVGGHPSKEKDTSLTSQDSNDRLHC